MPKLHELLAVESNHENQASKNRLDLANTFEKKRSHFQETRRTFTGLAEGSTPRVEEVSEIQTTVKRELEWITPYLVKNIDVSHQVDVANTLARADIVDDDGNVIAKDVPATSLLQLEKRTKEIRELLNAIPTLDPTKGFKEDSTRGSGYFQARDVETERKQKQKKRYELAAATKEHPCQAVLVDEDIPIGTIRTQEWSSMLTPAKKSELLERIDDLTRYVKRARARANEHEIDVAGAKIGKKLLDYVLVPLA
jgi:hypothetical protein